MSKDPAFLFYSNDFISGTQFFNDEQLGKYIRLLCAQHQHGRLDEKHMLSICKAYDVDIYKKFIRDSDGMFYNERLEDEINKRKKYTQSRRENASNKKAYAKHMPKHMENENTITISLEKKEEIFKKINDQISNDQIWKQQICKTYGKNMFDVDAWIREFMGDQKLKDDFYRDLPEMRRHFISWLKIKMSNLNKNPQASNAGINYGRAVNE